MPGKNIFFNFIKHILGGFEEADRRITSKKAEELLEEERKMMEERLSEDPLSTAAKMIKQKKEKPKRHFFSGTSDTAPVFFRPAVMSAVQQECEKWWFSLPVSERLRLAEKYSGGNSIKEKITRYTLSAGKIGSVPIFREQTLESMSSHLISVVLDTLFRYWPVFLMFLIMTVIFAVNIKMQSGIIALIGFILCCIILWQCRLIKVKKKLGLRFFCPFAVFFLQSVYIEEKGKEIKKGNRETKKNTGGKHTDNTRSSAL